MIQQTNITFAGLHWQMQTFISCKIIHKSFYLFIYLF